METAVVEFRNEDTGHSAEIEIPLSITANDLLNALNDAFNLGVEMGNAKERYLCAENPIAFLRGNKKLSDLGLRNGSIIIFKRSKE